MKFQSYIHRFCLTYSLMNRYDESRTGKDEREQRNKIKRDTGRRGGKEATQKQISAFEICFSSKPPQQACVLARGEINFWKAIHAPLESALAVVCKQPLLGFCWTRSHGGPYNGPIGLLQM